MKGFVVWFAALAALGHGSAVAEPSQLGAAAVSATLDSVGKSEAKPSSGLFKPDAAVIHQKPGSNSTETDVTRADAAGASSAPANSAGANPADVKPAVTAVAPPPPPPAPTLLFDIDLGKQRMTVTERGTVKHTWPISSGREGYRTPTGSFRPQWMAKMWYSKQYDDAPMPHSVFFNGGIAMHATQSTGLLGRPASHGCVRLSPANAETAYKLVSSHGKGMTRIRVFGTPKDNIPVASSRRPKPGDYAVRGDVTERYARSARSAPFAPQRYGYSGFAVSGGGSAPRYIYPGDTAYGYRPARPIYRQYSGRRTPSYYYD